MKFKNYLIENEELKIVALPPSRFSKEDIDLFIELLEKGGEVDSSGLKGRVKKSKLLSLCWDGETLTGVGALKIPQESYKEKVFEKIGFPEESENYLYEFGYLYIEKEYRKKGISKKILHSLLKTVNSKKIFVTIREENKIMGSFLSGYGFEKLGKSYNSQRGGYKLECFILK